MAERGKDKKCADCANWKVKDSQCTYYDDIVHGIIHKTDEACSDFYPKENQKSKIHKASGIAEQGYFEAIYHKQKPAFLTINKDQFRIYPEVTLEGEIFQPKEYPSEFPYEALAILIIMVAQYFTSSCNSLVGVVAIFARKP